VDYSEKEPSAGVTLAAIVAIGIAIGGTVLAASIIP
jgi:preprotein translocase subunit Sec61beta